MKQKVNDSLYHSNAFCINKAHTEIFCSPIYFLPTYILMHMVFFSFLLTDKKEAAVTKEPRSKMLLVH